MQPVDECRHDMDWQCALGLAMAREEMGEATHLFSMFGEFPTLLMAAKARGLRIVSEVYLLLETDRIMARERKQFPAWEPESSRYDSLGEESLSARVMLSHSDLLICPSAAVRTDLIVNRGVRPEASVVVPYGVASRWLSLKPAPKRGRVLFAGAAQLRKGIHYLAMAGQRLMPRIPGLEIRVAGNVSPGVARQPACSSLTFLGRIPRNQMQDEFRTADLFVLPSLAEGSAEVTYEALAAGVPVITTESAGSVIRDGVEGRIVPERDPQALASAIEELTEDRAKRDRMAVAARERARGFTWEQYGQRLLLALDRFHRAPECPASAESDLPEILSPTRMEQELT